MDKDMLLAKSPLPLGWIDMGVGDAVIVRESLMNNFRSLRGMTSSRRVDYSYQGPRGLPRLVRILESKYSQKVTVTVGAKNGLFLVFKALSRLGYKRIFSDAPYWVSFPAIASEAGLEFVVNSPEDNFRSLDVSTDVLLITSPNNPNSALTSRESVDAIRLSKPGLKVIHDAVYESKAYGFEKLEDLGADIKVYSAAKRYGLSGIRVGWVTTKWQELDSHLQELTEIITSGVCTLAQNMVADIITLMDENSYSKNMFYSECSSAFKANRESFIKGLGSAIDEQTAQSVLSRGGMFVWLPADGLNMQSEVRFVKGEAFGAPGMVRFSLGALNPSDAYLAGQRLGRK
jgi:aspartate/methionine/tyrosine aminotransferase